MLVLLCVFFHGFQRFEVFFEQVFHSDYIRQKRECSPNADGMRQCSTLTPARLPGASEIPLLASKATPRLAQSGDWDFCWSNLSLI